MTVAVRELADGSALVETADNEAALDLAAALAARRPKGLLDAVPGARTLLLLFDPAALDASTLPALLAGLGASARARPARTVRLQAAYGGEAGPDLAALAAEVGLAEAELVRMHAGAEHRVAFLGFAPGFAYLSGAPERLRVPRLKTPRVRVPRGSVALADGYTGIYPAETPGGWRLIGRVAARLFDPRADPPALLRPGDRVIFEPVDAAALPPDPGEAPEPSPQGRPLLRAVAPGPFSSVQGGARHGLLSSGVPAGGAMDAASLALANARVGNPPRAAALEITLAGPELEALEPVRVALAGAEVELRVSGDALRGPGPHSLRRGDLLAVSPLRGGARAYLAVEGGLAQPLPGAQVRPLRRGELLHGAPAPIPGDPAPEAAAFAERLARAAAELRIEVRALPGPQWERFTAAGKGAFFDTEWTVSPHSDRRGLRLRGPPLELSGPSDLPSEGTAPGAVQVPGDGLPIALGPDRPVTGGYAKIATALSADLPLLGQARPGWKVRFRRATLAEALSSRAPWALG